MAEGRLRRYGFLSHQSEPILFPAVWAPMTPVQNDEVPDLRITEGEGRKARDFMWFAPRT